MQFLQNIVELIGTALAGRGRTKNPIITIVIALVMLLIVAALGYQLWTISTGPNPFLNK
jgi:flagellar basal body-associated protein FliL